MRASDPNPPVASGLTETAEEKLRKEIEDLRRQLKEQQALLQTAAPTPQIWRPSGGTIAALLLGAAALIILAFFAGYIPLQKRTELIRREAAEREQAVPRVDVIEVTRSSTNSDLELPGSIQAITEAPILARANGYIRRRLVDIGDRVRAGQSLAEIEAPELDQQMSQAKATLQVAREALDQASANYERGKSNLELARVTADRWGRLVLKGAVSRQENDQYQAQYQAQFADVQALEKAIAAQRSNVAAAQANLARLDQLQSYRLVTAPFDGVITVRDVDTGTLVNAGNTLLFRIAQTGTLRIYVDVPQANAGSVHVGQTALLSVSNLPGRRFTGAVARTASALDPTTRTLLVELHVLNPDGALLPGMFAQVDLSSARAVPPLLVPGDALIVRGDSTEVALVRPDHTVHLQKIVVGRDYGSQVEVLAGLHPGDAIIPNAADVAREGLKVEPVLQPRSP
jgi:RND family efflux transporter MFP subunit